MMHQLLSLKRPLFVFDTETTGTDPQKDRIVEVGFQRWEAEGMTREWRSLVNPMMPIPASATKVHNITDAMVQACRTCQGDLTDANGNFCTCETPKPWPTFGQLSQHLAAGMTDCDFAGKRVRFDIEIMAAEMARAKVKWSYAGARIVDIDRLEQMAEPRSLSHLHKKYAGEVHDGAHGALSDVRASTTVIVGQLKAYPQLPRDLDVLHEAQWPGWIDAKGLFRYVDGVACFGGWGKWKGTPMNDAKLNRPDNRGQTYWDFILSGDFPEDVKQLARDAKLGKFPVKQ